MTVSLLKATSSAHIVMVASPPSAQATGPEVYVGEIFNGVDERIYDVTALAAGKTYVYVCTVHPNMLGTIILQ